MNNNIHPFDRKSESDNLKFDLITNKDLVCKDCNHRYDDSKLPCKTSICEAFDLKPSEILDGGDCIYYERED